MVTTLYDAKERLDILMVGEYKNEQESQYLEALSAGELAVYTQKRPEKKADFLLGRWVAKQVLCEYFKRLTGQVFPLSFFMVLSTKDGAPTVVVTDEVAAVYGGVLPHISISHVQGNLAAVRAVSGAVVGVGVDVEFVRPWNETLIKRYLTSAEYQFITAAPVAEQEKLATVFWSLKESYLKALRIGLRRDPQTVDMLRFIAAGGFEKKETDLTAGWVSYDGIYVVSSVLLS